MCTNFMILLRYQLMMIIGMFLITISLVTGPAEAGSNWLDKGKDIFKTYGVNFYANSCEKLEAKFSTPQNLGN